MHSHRQSSRRSHIYSSLSSLISKLLQVLSPLWARFPARSSSRLALVLMVTSESPNSYCLNAAVHSYLQSVQPTEFLKLSICRVGVDQQSHSAKSTTLHIICAGANLSIPGTNCPLCVSTAWGCLCGKVRAVTHFPSCLLHTCVSCWRLQRLPR